VQHAHVILEDSFKDHQLFEHLLGRIAFGRPDESPSSPWSGCRDLNNTRLLLVVTPFAHCAD
jgi:hypothetical protein